MLFSHLFFLLISVGSHMHSSYAAPCKADDADCMKDFVSDLVKTTINGIPAIGLETFDPFFIDEFKVNLADINIVFKNVTALGYKKCDVAELRMSAGSIKYDLICPALTMISEYEGNGQFSLLSIHGKGDAKFNTGKIVISIESDYKKLQNPNGKNYFQFENIKFTADAIDPIQFEISNLFGSHKEISDAFLKFAVDNWKLLSEVLLVPVLKPSLDRLFKSENKYLKIMKSYEDIITE